MSRLLQFWGLLAIAVALAGCRQADDEGPNQAVKEASQSFVGTVAVAENRQRAIGLVSAAALRRNVLDSISTTGWLAARPASEVIVKAPTTGFVTLKADNPVFLGDSVLKNQTLAELQVFLSPQEQAQLVAAKEEADILIQQSLATLKLTEEHLKRLEDGALTAVAGTRLLELREIVARSRAAEREAREKLPFLPSEPYEDVIRRSADENLPPLFPLPRWGEGWVRGSENNWVNSHLPIA